MRDAILYQIHSPDRSARLYINLRHFLSEHEGEKEKEKIEIAHKTKQQRFLLEPRNAKYFYRGKIMEDKFTLVARMYNKK